MNVLGYYPSSWDRIPLALSGFVLVVLAIVALALAAAHRDALAERSQALAGGLCIGTAGASACGVGLLVAQTAPRGPAFFLAPDNFRMGLIGGIGLGLLASLAIGAFIALRSAAIIGLLVGAVVGLIVLRLIFGPTAGFGGEVGLGVGQEVAVMFGAADGLLGGIVGAIVGLVTRHRRATASPTASPARRGWWWSLVGLAAGAGVAALIGVVGAQAGYFQFLVPYNGQIPDVPPDTSPAGLQRDFLFGLGMFVVGGALIGCFLALQWLMSGGAGPRRHGLWIGVGLVIALVCGLTFGLDHRYVGGPFISNFVSPDPIAGMRGLLIGLAAGVILGGALLLADVRLASAHPHGRMLLRTGSALIIGLLLLTLASWYVPLFAISIM